MIEGATFRIVAAGVPLSFVLTAGMVVAVPQGAPLRREPPSDRSIRSLSRVCEAGRLSAHETQVNARRPAPFRVVPSAW